MKGSSGSGPVRGREGGNEPLRVGVVGLGKMGLLHASLSNALPGSRLVSVCEPTDMIRKFFERFAPSVSTYSEYEKMLEDERLDAVFITTPVFLHAPMAEACAGRGIHFFIEKPVSTSEAAASSLRVFLEGMGAAAPVHMVGFMMRYLGPFRRAKSIIESGALGNLSMVQATEFVSQLFKKGNGWRYDRERSGGGVVISQVSHLIDLLCWYFGFPSCVSAHLAYRYSESIEDFANVLLRWPEGIGGVIQASWSVFNHRMLETSITVHGENGTLFVTDDEVRLFLKDAAASYGAGWRRWRRPELSVGVPVDIGGYQFTLQDDAFLEAVRSGTLPDSNVFNALRVQRVIDAVYASDNDGGMNVSLSKGGGAS